MAFINKHDTNGTKGLLAKGELGYDDYAAGGDTGRVYVGTGTENIALAERLESNMMTKAQFLALSEERKANRAGSGFEEWGKHHATVSSFPNINEGLWLSASSSNLFVLGRDPSSSLATGVSKTNIPTTCINGVTHKITYVNRATNIENHIALPTAPNIYPYDTVLTPEQIASGVIKHADASNSGLIVNGKFDTDTSGWTTVTGSWSISGGSVSNNGISPASILAQSINTQAGKEYIFEFTITTYISGGVKARAGNARSTIIAASLGRHMIKVVSDSVNATLGLETANYFNGSIDNIAVYPADAISRSDLSFPESWHEDVSEKNFVYPLGNTGYLGGNTDGLTGIANGAFTGFETYSLFGNWQTPSALIGKGYVWSSLTEAQKRAFIANPENNCYLDGDKTIQVRYRVRVVQGYSDNWFNVDPQIPSATGYMQSGNITNGGVYVYPKGKKTNISSEQGSETTTNGVYGTKYTAWTSSLTWNDNGVFIASSSNGSTTGFLTGSYNGQCFAIPLALVHRRNQGMYHNVFNPNGTKLASDGLDCFRTAISFTSISDCFDPAKLLTASGYIGTVSGRPDGLFYDQIHQADIIDLRNSSKKVGDYNRLITREFNKLVAGTNRGKEGEWNTIKERTQPATVTHAYIYIPHLGYESGQQIAWFDNLGNRGATVLKAALSDGYGQYWSTTNNVVKTINEPLFVTKSTTRTKSSTLLHCDIIGNPANYPTAWKQSGVFGTPLVVAEDGTSLLPNGTLDTFKLSRKANATPLLCLRSTDNGATWTSFTPTFSTTINTITLTDEPAGNLVLVYYQTKTSMAIPAVNSEVLELGEVWAGNSQYTTSGGAIVGTLLNKVSTGSLAPVALFNGKITGFKFFNAPAEKLDIVSECKPAHSNIPSLGTTASPAVKVLPYLTRLNGKAYLNLVFKEMKHNGTSWGDDSKFNIVDNVSTTTDNNAQAVLLGQKTVELPYFIGADE